MKKKALRRFFVLFMLLAVPMHPGCRFTFENPAETKDGVSDGKGLCSSSDCPPCDEGDTASGFELTDTDSHSDGWDEDTASGFELTDTDSATDAEEPIDSEDVAYETDSETGAEEPIDSKD